MRATNELKQRFSELKEKLGDDWKVKIYRTYPQMPVEQADIVISRVTRMGLGRLAPTLTELEQYGQLTEQA
ncbi:hypothetical protein [Siphonobacter sp. SORGH_AS_0500]|uniref:hypothetical protein n=1 Tax=Siphonobacter sp. SORGH_AS_0500 TaxID=1864824 RepID=UPI0028622B8C|nr:hypothetical protein [Siphonobacter sp. SORGH_AS_0500]MDR6196183.1 hypothetical protein [Siphonobacter sp. SORGH_AS_0500]